MVELWKFAADVINRTPELNLRYKMRLAINDTADEGAIHLRDMFVALSPLGFAQLVNAIRRMKWFNPVVNQGAFAACRC